MKHLLREEIKKMRRLAEVDLTTKEKSVAKYIQDNISEFEKLAGNPGALSKKIETDFSSLSVSDQYKKNFLEKLSQQRTPTARLMFLSNAMLKGAGLGAI